MKKFRLKSTGAFIDVNDIEEVPADDKEFITTDDVMVNKNTDVFGVDINFNMFNAVGRDIELMPESKFFSSNQMAEQYCMDNRALLSIMDICEILELEKHPIKDEKVLVLFNKIKQFANQKHLQLL